MANYSATARTNYFRVTDEKRYAELFKGLCSGGEVYDFTEEKDGVIYHGFGSYDSITWAEVDDDECWDYDLDKFLTELQKILPDDEAFMYFESGHEKLRYITGFSIVVTNKHIVSNNIETWATKKAKELIGNDFITQIDC
jgi:hypothetical protein